MSTYWEKKFYLKIRGFYVEKLGVSTVSLSSSKTKTVNVVMHSDDDERTKHYIAENMQDYIKRLERLGFKREEITIESETRATDVTTENVEIVETEVDGKKTLSLEKPKVKISSGRATIIDCGDITGGGITLTNGMLFSKSIITDPPHIHPDTEELNEYDIVKFSSYFPHMNVKSGDLAVVVKVYSDNVMVKKDGSTFPISRHHIKRVKN